MYGLILGSSYKDMTVFEYYYAAQRKFQDDMMESNKLASLERYQLKMILANVAHDLKTPLVAFTAGVHTIIKSLERFPRDSLFSTLVNEIRDTSLEMEASCVFMTSQINRAIDVSKSEHNVKLIGKYESVSIVETVNWAINIIKVVSHKVKITVCGTLSSSTLCAITDKCWMQDNLLCLLSNAVKYSPEESHILIHLNIIDKVIAGCHEYPDISDLTKATKYLLFEVEDHGIGVPSNRCDQLFRPFSQTQRRAGGTGLGLYSMTLRIRALNGFCGIRSANGHPGSVFYFGVPFSEDVAILEDSEMSSGLGGPSFIHKMDSTVSNGSEVCVGAFGSKIIATPATDDDIEIIKMDSELMTQCLDMTGNRCRSCDLSSGTEGSPVVLIVDDSPPVLKLVGRVLNQEGCLVHTAADGFRALQMMKERLYTLVIMDIQMPVMDGIESVRQLREWEGTIAKDHCHQYILGASANPDEGTKKEAINAGMNEFTTKPVSLSKLVSVIRGLHSPI
jgi:CheY-like chemotaxis protein/signal transduction histidine kinase